jgi:hypothetical protein
MEEGTENIPRESRMNYNKYTTWRDSSPDTGMSLQNRNGPERSGT